MNILYPLQENNLDCVMEGIFGKLISKETVKTSLFDVAAFTAIYLVPVFSHLFALPIYYIEPMRLMLVLAVLYTSRKNVFIIALTMPLFSMLVSGHPVFYKALIMSGELIINAALFYILKDQIKNRFSAMVLSIGLSKISYYAVKILLLNLALMSGEIISTPLWIQGIVIFGYSALIFIKEEN